jgi:hypothetical protein
MIYRHWQSRRVAYTNEVIAFAKVGEEILLDAIPLVEVTSIETMQSLEHKDTEKSLSENTFEVAVDISNAIQIRTKKDGYNAGRKYFLQASSDEELNEVLGELRSLSASATERAEANSKWAKMQERVRLFYNSSVFQALAAFLIIAVRAHIDEFVPKLAIDVIMSRTSLCPSPRHRSVRTNSHRTAPRPP